MADQLKATLKAGRSAEEIAYELLQDVAWTERKETRSSGAQNERADRDWILNTYAECLYAVQNPNLRLRKV